MVEAILVLILIVEYNVVQYLGNLIKVENIVHTANSIFLQDQRISGSNSKLCCLEKVR